MDVVFSNRISSNIFKQCAKAVVEGKLYSDTPIELRKKMEDCFDTYMEQFGIMVRGVEKLSSGEQQK